jgi:hypothetical protein
MTIRLDLKLASSSFQIKMGRAMKIKGSHPLPKNDG